MALEFIKIKNKKATLTYCSVDEVHNKQRRMAPWKVMLLARPMGVVCTSCKNEWEKAWKKAGGTVVES